MAVKKSQLYSSIWQACDALRGGMDASQYKDYVLVLLFIRYVSDKYSGKHSSIVEIPDGGSFKDLVALKGNPNIGEGINKVLSRLAEANELKGVIDIVDFNDEDKLGRGKEMQDRLSDLIAIFENQDLNFSKNKAEGDDLLGDAYEYLMKHFAVESGKSKGQFYTPAEVSRIIAKVIEVEKAKDSTQSVYDPACGSGSLLLKVASAAKPTNISIYGQEKDSPTAALAVLNMWLHGEPTAVIKKGQSTLSNPLFSENNTLKTFDYVVANPPFSDKKWRFGFDPENDLYGRFDGFGIPPSKNGDYAFLLHIIKSLKSTGKAACVLPHGVLFRGNAEAEIRKNLIKRGYIKAIIGLPANLFYGTGIPACILLIDKENTSERKGIFMIDASKGFIKDGNKNRLREQDIRKIIDVWENKSETPKFSHLASFEEIEKNEFNLNLPRYIDNTEEEDMQDIEAHLNGGIPEADINSLEDFWKVCPSLQDILFNKSSHSGYYDVKISQEDIQRTILEHNEFIRFKDNFLNLFNNYKEIEIPYLKSLDKDASPKEVIEKLSSDLLSNFSKVQLVNSYNIYQHLLNYWEDVIQDDVYIITTDEWDAGKEIIRLQKEGQGRNKGTKKDIDGLLGLEGRLIPTSLIIQTYLQDYQNSIDNLKLDLDQINNQMEEIIEENTGEEGLLESIVNDKRSINKVELKARIKEIKGDSEFKEELVLLEKYNKLIEDEIEYKSKIKNAEKELESKVISIYPKLSLDDIKNLIVEKKWMKELNKLISSEVETTSQNLTSRIKELIERYSETLPEIEKETKLLTDKAEKHLSQMGFRYE